MMQKQQQMQPRFKKGERVWYEQFHCFALVEDADITNLFTKPRVIYSVTLQEPCGERTHQATYEHKLQTEEAHNNAARD